MDTDIQLNGKFKNVNITPKYYPYKIKKKILYFLQKDLFMLFEIAFVYEKLKFI